jgi:OmpA-OmpF porin, OOP family
MNRFSRFLNLCIVFGLAISLSSCSILNILLGGGGTGGTYPSGGGNAPFDRRNDKKTAITRVVLTEQHTVLYVTYINSNRPQYDRMGRQITNGEEFIGIKPSSRLFALNGSRTFNLVRAEGIPYDPQRQTTRPGDRVDFVLYFERLDPGIQEFDLFECNDYDHIVCWNFYGIEVNNPAPNIPKPTTKPAPVPAPTPVPTPPVDKTPAPPVDKTKPIPTPTPTPAPTPPKPVEVIVKGIVTDAKTKKPVTAMLDFAYSLNKQLVDSIQSFQNTGDYRIKLLPGFVYQVIVSGRGYLVVQEVIDLTKVTDTSKPIQKDFVLTPVVVGDKISLKNIYFEMSKADLLKESYAELDRLVTLMTDNTGMEIRLEGHTDIIGDKELNMQLSKDRVWNVRKYLVSKGIRVDRIQVVGYGDTKPIVTKGTDEERKINRRVEFVILKL